MAVNGEAHARTPLLAGTTTDLSANGTSSVVLPSSTVLEPPNQRRSRWWSIRVMYVTMFMSAVTFTMTMSTIWPFLKVVDEPATPSLLGWVVASYSLGQVLASPLFGFWSAKRQARQPLLCSLFLQVGANIFYGYVQSIPANGAACLIAARVTMGFAAGNAAVVRAYVSAATTVEERTGAMANVSLFQSLGFILGPFIQTILVYVGYPGPVEKRWLHFNMYTSPALISAFFTVVNFGLILAFFRLHTVNDSTVLNTTVHEEEEEEEEEKEKGAKKRQDAGKDPPDYVAVGLSVFLFFVTFFVFTIFETIGTPLIMDMYGWTKAQASLNMGIALGVAGVVAIGVFLTVGYLAKKGKDERWMLISGFGFCFVGFFFLLPWGHDLPALSPAPINGATTEHPISNTTSPVNTTSNLPWQDGGQAMEALLAGRYDSNWTTADNNWTTANGNWTTSIGNWTTADSNWTTANSNWTTSISNWTTADSSNSSLFTTQASTASDNVTTTALTTAHTHTAIENSTASTPLTTMTTATEPLTTPAQDNTTGMTTVAPRGCPWYFAWCGKVPKIQLWQFVVGTFFIAIGYAICNSMTYSIYSKVLGHKPQGLWMGIITGSGSLARMLGPIFVSQMYDSHGPRVTFICTCVVLLLALIVNGIGWRRLLPFDLSPYRKGARGQGRKESEEDGGGVAHSEGSLQ